MARTHANILDAIELELDDTSNAIFSTTLLGEKIKQALTDISESAYRIVKVPFTVETRTGTATSTTASALVDATESQFASTDAGKVIHNTTDNTWAVVTAYVSATQLTLNKDIMASGENYEIYNAGCTSEKQINISSVGGDYLFGEHGVLFAEYPIGSYRNVAVHGTIVTLGIDYMPDDTAAADARKDAYVYFARKHKLSQLTDFAGAVNLEAGYAAGSTSMAIDNIQATGTIEQGQEFTIAGLKETYTVTADASVSGNAATISFFPGLEATASDNTVITLTASTLSPSLEDVLIMLSAGGAAMVKANSSNPYAKIGELKLAIGQRKLETLATNLQTFTYTRG